MAVMDGSFLKLLKGLEIFSELDSAAIYNLSSLFEEKLFSHGQQIFLENSIGNSMMIIISGQVRISQKADDETEEALIILKQGGVFGEMGLLEDLPRTAEAIAHTEVLILEITRENFYKFIENDPKSGVSILLKLAKVLSSRLRETDTKLKTFVNLSKWI